MHRPVRPRYRPPGVLYGATGRTATVRALIVRLTAENGTPPDDATLARLLACSVSRIKRHRALLAATPVTKG